jgi:hypothetical protein
MKVKYFILYPLLASQANSGSSDIVAEVVKTSTIEEKQEGNTKVINVTSSKTIEQKKLITLSVGLLASLKFAKHTPNLDTSHDYTAGSMVTRAGKLTLTAEINNAIMEQVKEDDEEKAKKYGNNHWENIYYDIVKISPEDQNENVKKLTYNSPFTGGLVMETLNVSKNPLKIGSLFFFELPIEFSQYFTLRYEHKKHAISFGGGLVYYVNTKLSGKVIGPNHREFELKKPIKSTSLFGWGLLAKYDYKVSEHVNLFAIYRYNKMALLGFNQISLGISHFVY